MNPAPAAAKALRLIRRAGSLPGLLRGYEMGVCSTPEAVRRALAVRDHVYNGECGYGVAVPDQYDGRSWLLQAVCSATGETVGTMRVTPRFGGPLELEEYFELPRELRSARVVELNRFAILPNHRKGRSFLPAVALGLMKLAVQLLSRLGAQHVIVCAKEERIWTYKWMCFESTGLEAPYGKLGSEPHEMLVADLRFGLERYRGHRFWEFFTADDPTLQAQSLPPLGIGIVPDPGEQPAAWSA